MLPFAQRARFIRCIYNLLDSESGAVRYDAAATLITLSAAPSAIEAAVKCYIELIMKESDNNIKLIVLDPVRLAELKNHPTHERVLQSLGMDLMRILAAPVRIRAIPLRGQMPGLRFIADNAHRALKSIVHHPTTCCSRDVWYS